MFKSPGNQGKDKQIRKQSGKKTNTSASNQSNQENTSKFRKFNNRKLKRICLHVDQIMAHFSLFNDIRFVFVK